MTSVVALIQDGCVYFGCDSLVVQVPSEFHSGVSQTVMNDAKIWKKQGMMMGAAGSLRVLQLLKYRFEPPLYQPGTSKMAYLVSQFVPDLQTLLIKEHVDLDDYRSSMLLAIEQELFTIGKEFQVVATTDRYEAIGKSSEVALGSLYTSEHKYKRAEARLRLALWATERHTCVVSSPFYYLHDGMEHAELLDDPDIMDGAARFTAYKEKLFAQAEQEK